MLDYIGLESILVILFISIFIFSILPLSGIFRRYTGDENFRRAVNTEQGFGGAFGAGCLLAFLLQSASGAWIHVAGYFRSGLFNVVQFFYFLLGAKFSIICAPLVLAAIVNTFSFVLSPFFDKYFDFLFPLVLVFGGVNLYLSSKRCLEWLQLLISLFVLIFSVVMISSNLNIGLVKYPHLVHPVSVFCLSFALAFLTRSYYFVFFTGLVIFSSIFNFVQASLFISGASIGFIFSHLIFLHNYGRAVRVVLLIKLLINFFLCLGVVGLIYSFHYSSFFPNFSLVVSDLFFSYYNEKFSQNLYLLTALFLALIDGLLTLWLCKFRKGFLEKLCFPEKQMQSLIFPRTTYSLSPVLFLEHMQQELKKQMAMSLNISQLVLSDDVNSSDLLRAKKYELIVQKVNTEFANYVKEFEEAMDSEPYIKEVEESVLLSFRLSHFSRQIIKNFVEQGSPIGRKITKEEKQIVLMMEEILNSFIGQEDIRQKFTDNLDSKDSIYVELKTLLAEMRESVGALNKV